MVAICLAGITVLCLDALWFVLGRAQVPSVAASGDLMICAALAALLYGIVALLAGRLNRWLEAAPGPSWAWRAGMAAMSDRSGLNRPLDTMSKAR